MNTYTDAARNMGIKICDCTVNEKKTFCIEVKCTKTRSITIPKKIITIPICLYDYKCIQNCAIKKNDLNVYHTQLFFFLYVYYFLDLYVNFFNRIARSSKNRRFSVDVNWCQKLQINTSCLFFWRNVKKFKILSKTEGLENQNECFAVLNH